MARNTTTDIFALRNSVPPKPTVSPYGTALWDSTRQTWVVRPKDHIALKRAGLLKHKASQPAAVAVAAATTTTTATAAAAVPAKTKFAPLYFTSSSSSSDSDSSDKENAVRPCPAIRPLPRPIAKKRSPSEERKLVADRIFKKPVHAGIRKRPAAPKLSREEAEARDKLARAAERAKIEELRSGVDPRLLACNPTLQSRETEEEREKREEREEEVERRGKEILREKKNWLSLGGSGARRPFLGVRMR
jgi:hypothetical protein